MKRHITVFLAVLCLACSALAQQGGVSDPSVWSGRSYEDGKLNAWNFGKWQVNIAPSSSITATGSQSFTANYVSPISTPDGLTFVPFAVNERITVGTGSQAEVVTISAVSGCSGPSSSPSCLITATSFANNHYAGEPVTSADSGLWEAFAYAQQMGGGVVRFVVDCGQITLSTSAATTTSTCFVPKQFYSTGASGYVNTTIATATNWAVGISGSTSAFCSADSTLTAGTTCIANLAAPALVGSTLGITAVLITTTGSQTTAGVVHVKVWGDAPVQGAY